MTQAEQKVYLRLKAALEAHPAHVLSSGNDIIKACGPEYSQNDPRLIQILRSLESQGIFDISWIPFLNLHIPSNLRFHF